MADSTNSFSEKAAHATEIDVMKKDLEGWREALLPLNKVLHWDKPHYPAIIVGTVSFFFLLIWYFEPSVLTTISLVSLVVCLLDYLVPTITSSFFTSQWTVIQEKQFEEICARVVNFRKHVVDLKAQLLVLKNDKPKVYFAVVMGTLAVIAWVGNCVDNLLLTYLAVCLVVLLPGLRHRGVLQKYMGQTFKQKTKKH